MNTKLFFWNIRGLNDPDKHQPFFNWLSSSHCVFGALLETHIKEPNLNPILSKICPGWNYTSNHASDEDGRIVVIWKHPAKVLVLHQTSQTITMEVQISGGAKFFYTAIYASNHRNERLFLWEELKHLHHSLCLDSLPWITGGDFNQILHPAEHSSLQVDHITSQMAHFRNCLNHIGLFDLRFYGPTFTWSNKRPEDPIAKKLDRLLCNGHWLSLYPNSQTSFLPPDFSDHSPSILDQAVPLPSGGSKPFKFFNYLTKHPDFLSITGTAWIQAGNRASSLSYLCMKLKTIKRALKSLNKDNFSEIQKRVRETNILLQCVQVQALNNPSPQTFQQEKDLHAKWIFLRNIEEEYFKQRSRIQWLKEGDLNTHYFHKVTEMRNSYNSIRSFTSLDGILVSDPVEMSSLAVGHFSDVLAPHILPVLSFSHFWLQRLSTFKCNESHKRLLSSLPSSSEIEKTLKKINKNKTPGPDGLTSGFYTAAWPILGAEVVDGLLNFFQTTFLPAATNATILTLVPKKPGATLVADFRPVSCCNTLYKIISKILVNRLKPLLPGFIVPNQTAFIKGRLLIENTLLAAEIVQGYHNKKGPKRLTIKVDIAKAFESLRWEFLFACLRNMDVPNQYIRWLEACVCTPFFLLDIMVQFMVISKVNGDLDRVILSPLTSL